MPRLKSLALTVVGTLALGGAARAGLPGIPSAMGRAPRSPWRALSARPDFEQVTCSYRKPLVHCRGIVREEPRSDVYYRFTATWRKLTSTRYHLIVCTAPFGVCKSDTVTMKGNP